MTVAVVRTLMPPATSFACLDADWRLFAGAALANVGMSAPPPMTVAASVAAASFARSCMTMLLRCEVIRLPAAPPRRRPSHDGCSALARRSGPGVLLRPGAGSTWLAHHPPTGRAGVPAGLPLVAAAAG